MNDDGVHNLRSLKGEMSTLLTQDTSEQANKNHYEVSHRLEYTIKKIIKKDF